MSREKSQNKNTIGQVIALALELLELNVWGRLVQIFLNIWQEIRKEGMYEVLEHEGILEILDTMGSANKLSKERSLSRIDLREKDAAFGKLDLMRKEASSG